MKTRLFCIQIKVQFILLKNTTILLTDNPVNESLNGWIKEELFIDFDLKYSENVPNLIKLYIDYYNNERPSYALNYKTLIQYKFESGF